HFVQNRRTRGLSTGLWTLGEVQEGGTGLSAGLAAASEGAGDQLDAVEHNQRAEEITHEDNNDALDGVGWLNQGDMPEVQQHGIGYGVQYAAHKQTARGKIGQ